MVAGIDVAPPDGLSTPRPVAGRQHFEMQVCRLQPQKVQGDEAPASTQGLLTHEGSRAADGGPAGGMARGHLHSDRGGVPRPCVRAPTQAVPRDSCAV